MLHSIYRFEMASMEWNVQHLPEKNLIVSIHVGNLTAG